MVDKLYATINEILKHKSLSISGITRELRSRGCAEHRLVLTGYLRALKDLNKIEESDIPPAKVYTRKEDINKQDVNIFSLLSLNLKQVEYEKRWPIAVYILSNLFKRPVFKQELKLVGINITNPKIDFKTNEFYIKESDDTNLKKYRDEITKISIPSNDEAYEIMYLSELLVQACNIIMAEMIKDVVEINGLIPKTQQTKLDLTDF
ncbi:hypothetical protein [Methanosalsum natronophilum]|uniref:Uncharacterized protein n=1 Tax=Methanosalsum natronophilum TaxID=768733 RepID=A0A3R7VTK7_9EURY|nr:hypothetical protein [Methanosalsum natronophilum]MCS3924175.1 hypothetical protein [Methanosalsum natronophilum]RQD85622.1 MAG: hypothetical protein D5R95_04455 [Methanosalsum natronophilum]